MNTKRLRLMAALALMATLSACGTIDGIGQDISGASNRVSRWM